MSEFLEAEREVVTLATEPGEHKLLAGAVQCTAPSIGHRRRGRPTPPSEHNRRDTRTSLSRMDEAASV